MEQNTTTNTIKVPKQFWDDHLQRDLAMDTYEVRELKWHFVLTLSDRDLIDLMDDAHHYATEDGLDFELMGLKSSARATFNAIKKQIGDDKLSELWFKEGNTVSGARFHGLPIPTTTI